MSSVRWKCPRLAAISAGEKPNTRPVAILAEVRVRNRPLQK